MSVIKKTPVARQRAFLYLWSLVRLSPTEPVFTLVKSFKDDYLVPFLVT
jgi:hypothetical protein